MTIWTPITQYRFFSMLGNKWDSIVDAAGGVG